MKAVIWTDVAQFLLYLSGSLASFFLLAHRIPGGLAEVVQAAAHGHKFRSLSISRWSFTNPAKKYTFWSGVIGGTFLTMASHGTDQTIVQRLLAARNPSATAGNRAAGQRLHRSFPVRSVSRCWA